MSDAADAEGCIAARAWILEAAAADGGAFSADLEYCARDDAPEDAAGGGVAGAEGVWEALPPPAPKERWRTALRLSTSAMSSSK